MNLIIFLLIIGTKICGSARILGVVPTPSYSHQVVFHPLWKELSLRGHEVVVLTTNPMNDSALTNLTEIDLSFSYKILEDRLPEIINITWNIPKIMYLTGKTFIDVNDAQLGHPEVQKLIHDPKEHFDLLIVEYAMAPVFYFSRRFNCPYIGVITVDATNFIPRVVGNPTHPIAYPDALLGKFGKPTLFERILLVLIEAFLLMAQSLPIFYSMEQDVVWKHFQDNTPINTVRSNVSLLFINSDPVLGHVRPLVPSTIQIGGTVARLPVKPLSKDVRNFLDESHEGFIYFSLGSNAKSKDIPPSVMNIILQSFEELPYKVLWKFELDKLPNKPKNVMISKWLSQQEVLRHPNLKLFITHGGAQSMEETITARIPIVGMPVYVDQPYNINKMVKLGFGLSVNYKLMTKEEFKNVILEVINNPKYRKRISELADLSSDQPMTGLEKAVWWTEYVIRHKGAAHLRSPLLDIPWYQYFFLDVCAVLLALLSAIVYFIILLVKLIRNLTKKFKIKKE